MWSFLLKSGNVLKRMQNLFDTTCIGYLPHRLPSPFDYGCYNHMGTEGGVLMMRSNPNS